MVVQLAHKTTERQPTSIKQILSIKQAQQLATKKKSDKVSAKVIVRENRLKDGTDIFRGKKPLWGVEKHVA